MFSNFVKPFLGLLWTRAGLTGAVLILVLVAAAHLFLVPVQDWRRWVAEDMVREDLDRLMTLARVPSDLGTPIVIRLDDTKVLLSNMLALTLKAIIGDNPDVCTIAASVRANSDPLRLKRGQSEKLDVEGKTFVLTVQDCSFGDGTVTALLTWPAHPGLQR